MILLAFSQILENKTRLVRNSDRFSPQKASSPDPHYCQLDLIMNADAHRKHQEILTVFKTHDELVEVMIKEMREQETSNWRPLFMRKFSDRTASQCSHPKLDLGFTI